jgi:hypothetical protein
MARENSRLRERRGHERLRAEGGPDHQLVFTGRVIATLVVLRFQLPHAALALLGNRQTDEIVRGLVARAVDLTVREVKERELDTTRPNRCSRASPPARPV